MAGILAEAQSNLVRLAESNPEWQPLPLGKESTWKGPLSGVVLSSEGLVPLNERLAPCGNIRFEHIERAQLTEGVGTNYVIEMNLSNDESDVTLVFNSRIVFLTCFAALRANDVSCQFNFTKPRQAGASSEDPVRSVRWLVAVMTGAAIVAALWQLPDFAAYFKGSPFIAGSMAGIVFLAGMAVVMLVFTAQYDAHAMEESPMVLSAESKPTDKPVEIDGQPLGLEMIGAESFEAIDTGQPRSTADAAVARISDIERLLEE